MQTRRRLFLIALPAVTILAGCGGGGSSTPFPLATRLRLLQVGDSWTYDVTGQVTVPGQSPVMMMGTLTLSVVQENVGGQTVLGRTTALNLTVSGGGGFTSNGIVYGDQEPNTRDVVEYAVRAGTDPVRLVLNNPLPAVVPGTWGIGTSLAFTLNYSDGSTNQGSLTVIGQEVVDTALGRFNTWKTTETSADTLAGTSNQTNWWAPQMGSPIKMVFLQTEADGTTLNLTATLRSSTVSPQ